MESIFRKTNNLPLEGDTRKKRTAVAVERPIVGQEKMNSVMIAHEDPFQIDHSPCLRDSGGGGGGGGGGPMFFRMRRTEKMAQLDERARGNVNRKAAYVIAQGAVAATIAGLIFLGAPVAGALALKIVGGITLARLGINTIERILVANRIDLSVMRALRLDERDMVTKVISGIIGRKAEVVVGDDTELAGPVTRGLARIARWLSNFGKKHS